MRLSDIGFALASALVACSAITSFDDFVGASDVVPDAGDAAPPSPPAPTPPPADASADGDASPSSCVEREVAVRFRQARNLADGGVPWDSPQLAISDVGAAKVTLPAGGASAILYLDGIELGGRLPLDAGVRGFDLRLRRDGTSSAMDHIVRLYDRGTPISENRAIPGSWSIEGVVTYGGPTDTWGAPLSPRFFHGATGAIGIVIGAGDVDLDTAAISNVVGRLHYCAPDG